MKFRTAAAAMFLCAGGSLSQAGVITTLSFGLINGGINLGVGGTNQLVCEVRDDLPNFSPLGANQARFRFLNMGPIQSSITDIYFEDGSLLSIASVINNVTSGVSFSQYASPRHLPSHTSASPAFASHKDFQADSDSPAQPNGVNPGEEVSIIFNLQSTKTIADVLACLSRAGEAGYNPADHDGLRIGLHIQGYADGSSNSYVNLPPPPDSVIPLPNIAGLGLAGLGIIIARRSRRS